MSMSGHIPILRHTFRSYYEQNRWKVKSRGKQHTNESIFVQIYICFCFALLCRNNFPQSDCKVQENALDWMNIWKNGVTHKKNVKIIWRALKRDRVVEQWLCVCVGLRKRNKQHTNQEVNIKSFARQFAHTAQCTQKNAWKCENQCTAHAAQIKSKLHEPPPPRIERAHDLCAKNVVAFS